MSKICFIPLRKGSKGIPDKNSKLFCGKPLFCWCLDTLKLSGIADEIWIATDNDHIKEIVRAGYPDVSIFDRSEESATDEAPTIDVVLEFLHAHSYAPEDWFVLLQATSPLTSTDDLQLLDTCLANGMYDSILACLRMKRFRWTDDGKPLDYDLKTKPRRQEYSGFLVETGSFYASRIGNILATAQLSSGRIGVAEVGEQALIDIDEPIDWCLGEAYCVYMMD